MILSRPRVTILSRLGRDDEVGNGLLQVLGRGLLPRRGRRGGRGGGEHLGGKAQRIGHLPVGAADDLGQVVRGDRVAGRAADELLDARLGVVHRPQGPHELGGVGDPPGGPDGDLDLLAVGGGHVHQLLRLMRAVPDLERLGQPEDLLDQGQLEVESRLGPAGDRLAELQEHGQLALAHRVADGPAQGNDQDQEHTDQDGKPSATGSFAALLPSNPGSRAEGTA